MDVSENSGTPKSSILMGFSIINHPFGGNTIFGNTHITKSTQNEPWVWNTHHDRHFFRESSFSNCGITMDYLCPCLYQGDMCISSQSPVERTKHVHKTIPFWDVVALI